MDPWPCVLSLPGRFVGDPASLARDNTIKLFNKYMYILKTGRCCKDGDYDIPNPEVLGISKRIPGLPPWTPRERCLPSEISIQPCWKRCGAYTESDIWVIFVKGGGLP